MVWLDGLGCSMASGAVVRKRMLDGDRADSLMVIGRTAVGEGDNRSSLLMFEIGGGDGHDVRVERS